MDLDRYVDELRRQMMTTAEAGGTASVEMAERLLPALESSVRLVLLEALADAAADITVELAPGWVEVRLRGRDPEVVVTPPPAEPPAAAAAASDTPGPLPTDADESGTSRISLRLPESLKVRIEDAAARQSVSVNAWLVRTVSTAVDGNGGNAADPGRVPSVGSRFTGWAR